MMRDLSLSERYALAAVLLLAVLVWLNRPFVTIPAALVGLAAGAWVARQEKLRRAAILALVAFALSLVFAVITLAN